MRKDNSRQSSMTCHLRVRLSGTLTSVILFWFCGMGRTSISTQIAVVGKGLTFDSGGYNIKAGAGSMIELMKVSSSLSPFSRPSV